jgi:Peptidase family M28
VVSPEHGDKPGTLVLVAHYDAGRTGLVFARWVQERRAALAQAMRRPIGHFEPVFWAQVVLLVCCVLRLVGVSGPVLTTVQFVCTAGLIVAVALLVEVAVSNVVPRANDSASGVGVALALADRHGGRLEHFDLWVLLTGAKEALSVGMRAFMRSRRRQLDRQRTVLLNLDEVGAGTVRFTRREAR